MLVAVAWPYAQGSLHLGHIAGVYLPADIFARYHRAIGNDVIMVSGSDVHGTPITVKAEQENTTPQGIVDRYHPEFLWYWDELSIAFDLFTTTGTANHREVAQDFFLTLRENGYMFVKETEQYYDPEADRFLPDRYVNGTCPHCGYTEARGDQCENCGRTLDPEDLIDPRSSLTGTTPELRKTEHFYLKLTALQDPLLDWLKTREGWRAHVLNFVIGYVEEGLHDRAFTRDLDWGIPLPVDDLGPGKSIYVWWEAVMGYLSAAKEWAASSGDPEAWRTWWEDPEALSYYFIGKDNIPFHAIFWPAMLIGYGGLNLPTDVPANQFVTFKGEKASKSRGVGKPLPWYLEHFEPDALRYALGAILPETADTDVTEDELIRKINDELVSTWGNLVHRVASMTHQYFEGAVPGPGVLADEDDALHAQVSAAFTEVGELIAAVRLRPGLAAAMTVAQEVNGYLTRMEPWKTAKTDIERTGTTLFVATNAIASVATLLAPYLPVSSRAILEGFGLEVPAAGPVWQQPAVASGTALATPKPPFAKFEVPEEVASEG